MHSGRCGRRVRRKGARLMFSPAAGDDHLGVAAAGSPGRPVWGSEGPEPQTLLGVMAGTRPAGRPDRRLARRVLPGPGGEHPGRRITSSTWPHRDRSSFEQAAGSPRRPARGRECRPASRKPPDGGTGSPATMTTIFYLDEPLPDLARGRARIAARWTIERCDSLLSYRPLRKDGPQRPACLAWRQLGRAGRHSELISGTCSGTISLPAVFATISSTLTPGRARGG